MAQKHQLNIIVEAQLIIKEKEVRDLPKGKLILKNLKNIFTYKNPKFVEAVKWGRATRIFNKSTKQYDEIPPKLYSYSVDYDLGRLCISRGGKEKVIEELKKFNVEPIFHDRTLVLPSISFEHSNIILREDQKAFKKDMLAYNDASGIAYASFGKTVTGLEIIREVAQPALVLVHTTFLQEQWIKEATSSKLFNMSIDDIGGVGGIFKGKRKLGKLNICLYHSLMNEDHLNFFKDKVGLIFFDEGQKSPVDGVQAVVNQFRARFRYTASANLERKDGKQFLTFDTFGPVKHIAIEKNSDSKILAMVNLVKTGYYDMDYEIEKNYSNFITTASLNKDRNIFICKRVIRHIRDKKLVIIFVERKIQAAILFKMLSKFKGEMLLGKFTLKQEELNEMPESVVEIIKNYDADNAYERILKLANKKLIDYVICTQKAEVGLSIRPFDRGIITTPMGNNIERFNQAKGRIERTYSEEQEEFFGHKKPTPELDLLVDANEVSLESASAVKAKYGQKYVRWVKIQSSNTNVIIRKKGE